jgi:serine/threonine-protein kinase
VTSTAEDPTVVKVSSHNLGLTTNVGVSPPSNPNTPSSVLQSGSLSTGEDRFIPGTVIADRYRIVALLGKGGMSEVYRVNDLKLGQPAALKFLPESISRDQFALERFHNEVRIARRISHPNVCRVYDIGEVNGHHFISMEYVDGEDLGSLLRRIGRLPKDKALDIARDLCAGLTAAHDQGILHRDLKPANVMVDGRGHVLIMDFGIAALSDQISEDEIRSGTPAYMAPEQISGKEVTVRSDIYALGLVLCELFTGKRAVESETRIELARLHRQEPSSGASHLAKGLDPAVEDIILRCLEKDPAKRPASAREVAAALPGDDTLGAVRMDRRTLSPEMVAAAASYAGIRPAVGVGCLAAIIIGLIIAPYLARRTNLIEKLPMEDPPEVLVAKSREMLKDFGYTQRPVDKASGFFYDLDYLKYAQSSPDHSRHLSEGRPAAVVFWYREDSRYLEPTGVLKPWTVTPDDPPPILSGMLYVETDVLGRLTVFNAMPRQVEPEGPPEPGADAGYDWSILFSAAGLDISLFTPTKSTLTPLAVCDARAAWTGNYPGQADIPLRIEAAAYKGKPVYFKVVGPWFRPKRTEAFEPRIGDKIAEGILIALFVLVPTGAALMARKNLRRDNGDTRGALRLAVFIFGVSFLSWVIGASHVPSTVELRWFLLAIANALLNAGISGMIYIALEPYVRRGWPKVIVSWSRLLSGQLRDPLVGRDVMVGILFGLTVHLLSSLSSYFLFLKGAPPSTVTDLQTMLGMRQIVDLFFGSVVLNSVQAALIALFLFFALRIGLRLRWGAGIPFVLIIVGLSILTSGFGIQTLAILFIGIAAVFVMLRYGLVSFIFLIFTFQLLGAGTALTSDFSAWYLNSEIFSMLVLLGLAGYSLHSALAGKSIFKTGLLKESL